MKTLSKSFAFFILFVSSAAVFIGAMIFTHKDMPIKYNSNSQIEISKTDKISWGVDFKTEKDGMIVISNITQNSYAKSIGLKENDKIVRLNEIYHPSIKEMENFLQNNKNKIVNIVIKRGENLYNIKALPF